MCSPADCVIPSVVVQSRPPPSQKRKIHALSSLKAAPAKKSRNLKKNGVRFSTQTSTIVYHHVSKLELKQAWNQPQDVANIKSGIRQTIRALHEANGKFEDLDETEHSFRGLESGLFPAIGKMRKLWAKTTTQNILDEQRLQKEHGFVDAQRLSAISRFFSEDAVRCAANMAALDAKQSR